MSRLGLSPVLLTLSLLPLTSCGAGAWDGAPSLRPGDVAVYGALREIIHEGKTGATVSLGALLPNPDLCAVGALADLAGEVTIVAGRAYLSHPDGDEAWVEVESRTDAAATLLVAAEVPAWQSVVTEREIRFDELDREIEALARAARLDVGERFPFLVEGRVEDLQWHVVDGRRLPPGPSSHEEHVAAGVKASRARTPAVLVGFYSAHDQGVFTHMGSTTHVHCVVEGPLAAGHVDHVTIPPRTTIRFPAFGTVRDGVVPAGGDTPLRRDPGSVFGNP